MKTEESIVEESRGRGDSTAREEGRFALAVFLGRRSAAAAGRGRVAAAAAALRRRLFVLPTAADALVLRAQRVYEARSRLVALKQYIFFKIETF